MLPRIPQTQSTPLGALCEGTAGSRVAREPPTASALGDLLERARAAVVRGLPSEALAVLDHGWEGASRTEAGWYFRAAALILLGQPGEADRVLQQSLVPRGGSVALHFLHSVARDLQADSTGARESLANALARRPGHALLVSWQAVLLARSGDRAGAQALLAPLIDAEPESSVFIWARKAINASSAQLRHDEQLLGPIRMGLLLLQEAWARDGSRATLAATRPGVRESAAAEPTDDAAERPHGKMAAQIPSLAILCMALAFAALLAGYGIASIALAGGASWLVLRNSIAASRGRRQPIEQVTPEHERH